jgi:hypothetical protein
LGEPTTNFVPGTYGYTTYAYVSGPVDTTVFNEKNQLTTVKRYTITEAINTARARILPSGLTTGVAYTFSFKWKYNGTTTASPSVGIDASKGNPEGGANNNSFTSATTNTVSIGNGWYLSTYTFVFSSVPTGQCMLTFGIVTGSTAGFVGETFDIYEAQFEIKNHRTQYSNGTRSATQGLKDLTAKNTINISTVSFDSNAQMTFDGTDDTLDTGIPLTSFPALSNFSIECMAKINSYPTAAPPNGYGSITKAGVLLGAAYYSGTALYWYGNSSGSACTVYAYIRGADAYRTAGGFDLTPGRHHHLVLVNDYTGGTLKLYANGTLNGSATTATQEYNPGLTPSAGNIGISKAQVDGGGELVYSYLPCEVPSVKLYNRVLTASDVQRNFNAVKSRFNIA